MRRELITTLNAEGFRISSRQGIYLRGPNLDEVEHHVIFETQHAPFTSMYQISVAVKHNGIERSLQTFLRELGVGWMADVLGRGNGGYILAHVLGTAPVRDLTSASAVVWIDGATSTLKEAVERLATIQTLGDIHAHIVDTSPARQSWFTLTEHDLLRWLLVYEWLSVRGLTWRPMPDELTRLRAEFSKSTLIGARSFDQVRDIAQSVVR